MKKIILLFFTLFFLINGSSGQFTSGGKKQNPTPTDNVEKTEPAAWFKPTVFFIRVGSANPTGSFGAINEPGGQIHEPFEELDGLGGQTGFALDFMAQAYLFQRPKFALGVQLGLTYSYNSIDWSNISGWDSEDIDPLLLASITVGPVASFPIYKNLIGEFAIIAAPTFYDNPGIDYYSGGIEGGRIVSITPDNQVGFLFGNRWALRYKLFTLGIDFIQGNLTYDYDIYVERWENLYQNTTYNTESHTANFPVNTVRVMFGVLF